MMLQRRLTQRSPSSGQRAQRSMMPRPQQRKQSMRASVSAAAAAAPVTWDDVPASTSTKKNFTVALIFDCDGVIVETEELHRLAYNAAFSAFGLTIDGKPLEWSTEYYDILQNTVGGGKPKMKYHFNANGWPASTLLNAPAPTTDDAKNKLVDMLQDKKTEHYKIIVESAASARPGVLELMDEGLAREDVAMCICSAATKEGFVKVVNSVVGRERLAKFDVILAGDDVSQKKPHPEIYNLARQRLGAKLGADSEGLAASRCVVIEDSMVGLRAATAAGMTCIITPTSSTANAPFCEEGAAAVVECLGGPAFQVSIDDIFTQVCDEDGCALFPDTEGLAEQGELCSIWSVSPRPFAT